MKDTKSPTAKELAGRAGVTAQFPSRILRTYFNHAGKTLIEDNNAAAFVFRNLKPEGWHSRTADL